MLNSNSKHETEQNGKLFVKAIIGLLKEKGAHGESVLFDPAMYEDTNDIPQCSVLDRRVSLVTVASPDEIEVSVDIDETDEDGEVVNSTKSVKLSGTEVDEDFEKLFFETYYILAGHNEPEAEEWLERFQKENLA